MIEYNKTDKATLAPSTTPVTEEKLNLNPASIAFLAAGIGCAAFGWLILLVDAIPGFKKFMTFSTEVGPLSGKVAGAVLIWLLSWGVLYFTLKDRKLDFNKFFIATIGLIVMGLLLSFPPFYQLFTAK